ncbi:DUF6270 domain-containing protein [Isoptericola sp. NPDC057391]|uniref:DUF6270 domain-containing protein n=1 Tax=Isoptericola sp. NPDC057391 TaxID=3346117 RepID=UPI00364146A1
MSKTRVFIYGSCVSRDTFEHFDPEQFELIRYVARQSALSAYTRPVTLVEPPVLESSFQQRMVSGDYASDLQTLIPELASVTDLVLVDLTDERLGAYILPDGSVVTRSVELVQSGAESRLPAGSQHIAFGSDQHFHYWSSAISAVGELFRQHMPRAAVVLLDVPWADRSESGTPVPASFGMTAADVNPLLRHYTKEAARALGAELVTVPDGIVSSSANHPWGDAPFHYSRLVYRTLTEQITGTEGRDPWAPTDPPQHVPSTTTAPRRTSATRVSGTSRPSAQGGALAPLENGPNLIVAGAQRSGVSWLRERLAKHPDAYVAGPDGRHFFAHPGRLGKPEEIAKYEAAYADHGGARWRVDVTPTYFWHAAGGPFSPKRHDAAKAVHNRLGPDTEVLVALRDPVSRAVSGYWHTFAGGHLQGSSGIFQVPTHFGVVDLGFYRRHHEHWAASLGVDRVHVHLYDDLVADPETYLRRVLRSLRLEASPEYLKNAGTQHAEGRRTWLAPFKKQSQITPQEIAALLELYRDDIAYVEDLLGRDLPEWRDLDRLIERHTSQRS